MRQGDEAVAKAVADAEARAERLEERLALALAEAEAGSRAGAVTAELEATVQRMKQERAAVEERASQASRTAADASARAQDCEAELNDVRKAFAEATAAAASALKKAQAQHEHASRQCAALEESVKDLRHRPTREAVAVLEQKLELLERLQQGEGGENEAEGGGAGGADGGGGGGGGEGGDVDGALSVRGASGEDGDVMDWVVRHTARLKGALEAERGKRRAAETLAAEAVTARDAATAEAAAAATEATRLAGDLSTAHQVVEAGKHMLSSFMAKAAAQPPPARGGWLASLSPRKSGGGGGGRGSAAAALFPFSADSKVAEADVEVGAAPMSPGFGASDRMLTAVQGQRDRFRREAHHREGELALAKTVRDQLTAEVTSLKRDNAALYKKVRYLSTSGGGGRHGSGKAANDAMDGTEAKYAAQYEAEVDPFSQWEHNERRDATDRLLLPERLLLSCLEGVVPSKRRRLLLGTWILFLHAAAAAAVYTVTFPAGAALD